MLEAFEISAQILGGHLLPGEYEMKVIHVFPPLASSRSLSAMPQTTRGAASPPGPGWSRRPFDASGPLLAQEPVDIVGLSKFLADVKSWLARQTPKIIVAVDQSRE